MPLTENQLSRAAEVLKTIAVPTRVQIIRMLVQNDSLNVSAIQTRLGIHQSVVSHHLTKMKGRGILVSRRAGKETHYSVAEPEITRIVTMLVERRSTPERSK